MVAISYLTMRTRHDHGSLSGHARHRSRSRCGWCNQRASREVRGVTSSTDLALLELAAENTEFRLQLAEAQEQCVELAVDAGELHVEIEALRAQLAQVEQERDAWRTEAERLRRSAA